MALAQHGMGVEPGEPRGEDGPVAGRIEGGCDRCGCGEGFRDAGPAFKRHVQRLFHHLPAGPVHDIVGGAQHQDTVRQVRARRASGQMYDLPAARQQHPVAVA